jgi:ABC-type siderophore export system fused ATPase/permease subunit
MVVIAVLFRSAGEEWHTFDLWFSLIGTTLWLTVSIAWKDRALILLNVTMALFLLKGVIYA